MERTSMHHAVTDGSEGIDRRSYCRQLCLNRRWQGFLVLLKKIVGIGEIRVIEKVLQTSGTASLQDLLNYSDFSDSNNLLQQHKKALPSTIQAQLPAIASAVNALAPVRNRVMHTRPLHFDDLASTLDTANELLKRSKAPWPALDKTLRLLQDEPSFVLSLDLPAPSGVEAVSHNLPIPDFDETGFIGREDLLKRLRILCQGPYPVITIVGEGGLGK